MPYPNRAQWVTLWASAVCAFCLWAGGSFFEALLGFNSYGGWAFPGWVSRHAGTGLIAVGTAAVLLAWHWARPVAWRSPILIPAAFVILCGLLGAAGAVRSVREVGRIARSQTKPDALDEALRALPAAKPR